jgi:hypothetical protein
MAQVKKKPYRLRNEKKEWTKKQKLWLLQNWSTFHGSRAAQEYLGKSDGAIIGEARKLGLPPLSQGKETMKQIGRHLGLYRDGVMTLLRECGAEPVLAAPLRHHKFTRSFTKKDRQLKLKYRERKVVKPTGVKWRCFSLESAEFFCKLRDTQTATPHRWDSENGNGRSLTRKRMLRSGLHPKKSNPKNVLRVPVGVLQEVNDQRFGRWVDVWRKVLAYENRACAPWFLTLAVMEVLQNGTSMPEWRKHVTGTALKDIKAVLRGYGIVFDKKLKRKTDHGGEG